MKPPCKDCQLRYIGCHGLCEEYQQFAKAQEDRREQRFETLARENDWYAMKKEGRRRTLRSHK